VYHRKNKLNFVLKQINKHCNLRTAFIFIKEFTVCIKIVSLYISLQSHNIIYLLYIIIYLYYLFQNEESHLLTTNCGVKQVWTDHRLKWNASEFAGIKVVHLSNNRIWRPDIILYNK